MEINRKSWHYRMNCYMDGEGSVRKWDNLCSYFWKTVFNVILKIVMWGLLTGVGIVALFVFYTMGGDVVSKFIDLSDYAMINVVIINMITGLMLFAAVIACVVVLMLSIFVLPKAIKDSTSDNLVTQYIKAKKQKYCPRIEFKD